MAEGSEAPALRLSMQGIGKSFGGVPVLQDVRLEVRRGEIVALLGGNGAGKSTLMKILTGIYRRDAGLIEIDGKAVDFANGRTASAAGVCLLPQEVSVMPDMTVAENILLRDLPLTSAGFVNQGAMQSQAAALLADLGFAGIAPDQLVGSLSTAEQRIVEIARALASDARILIMDEPTAALTANEAEKIFVILRRLKTRGTAIIYISHYLSEVFDIADRMVVLRDGRNAGVFVPGEHRPSDVVAAMLGRSVGAPASKGMQAARPKDGPAMLEGRGVSCGHGLRNIDFSLAKGSILGVFGLIGSGIETLGRAIYGATARPVTGALSIEGRPYKPLDPVWGKACGLGFVAAERKREGIIADLSVRENFAAAFLRRYRDGIFLSRRSEVSETERFIGALGVRTRGPEQTMRTLSGGNQQKICVARWLTGETRILILEEPTRGVDVGARQDLYTKLRELRDGGLSILVLSSDVDEIAELADEALVLVHGSVAARFDRQASTSELLEAAIWKAAS